MSNIILPDNYMYFQKPMDYGMTHRQLSDKKMIAEFIQWGRRNPDKFADYPLFFSSETTVFLFIGA